MSAKAALITGVTGQDGAYHLSPLITVSRDVKTVEWTRVPIFKRYVLAGLMLSAVALPLNAQPPNCAGITGDKALAACHAWLRRSHGSELERKLIARGEDASVFVEEAGDAGSGGYPRLIIWTWMDKDKAYQLNDQTQILETARAVGFRTLVYVDKGEDKNWYFSLTKPGKAALDVVPWQVPWWKRKD